MHILFVCTGNICRSPTAERLANEYATQQGIHDFAASSAGTRAVIGHPVHPDAAEVLRGLGGDPTGFAARQLTLKVAGNADLILTMTRRHRDSVLELAPNKLHRTFTLAEASQLVTMFEARTVAELANLRPQLASHAVADIADPIGHGPDVFETVGGQIADLLLPVIELCRA